MDIPYTVQPRPDTGLFNAKVGIWLFLASEVMLFGALFSSYILLRVGADPVNWPHGLLNIPIGTFNTAVLITSSITVVMAWASLKMGNLENRWHSDDRPSRRDSVVLEYEDVGRKEAGRSGLSSRSPALLGAHHPWG